MRQLSTRTADFTDSIIRRMTRISNRYEAINLSQGFPDFDPPREITDRLADCNFWPSSVCNYLGSAELPRGIG